MRKLKGLNKNKSWKSDWKTVYVRGKPMRVRKVTFYAKLKDKKKKQKISFWTGK